MDARRFLGTLALACPATIAAHTLLYGSEHTLGGAAHSAVLEFTLSLFCAGVLALCSAAFFLAPRCASGSILAARLAPFMPGRLLLYGTSALCLMAIEHAEPAHHGAGLMLWFVLAATVLAVHAIATAAVATVARFVLHITTGAHEASRPLFEVHAGRRGPRVAQGIRPYQLWSRPPPQLFLLIPA